MVRKSNLKEQKIREQEIIPIELEGGEIIARGTSYYLRCETSGDIKEMRICKVNPINQEFVTEMAKDMLEEIKIAQEMEQWS